MFVVSDSTTYLLEHLIHISQNGAVEVPVPVLFEAVLEAALRHFEHGVLDGLELGLDSFVVTEAASQS